MLNENPSRALFTLSLFISLWLVSISMVIPAAGIITIKTGDIIEYEITDLVAPFRQLARDSRFEGFEIFDNINFVGSTLFVKILRSDPSDGWYTVGLAGTLGVESIFWYVSFQNSENGFFPITFNITRLSLEKDAGLSFSLPEIRYWTHFDFEREKIGLFYLDQSRWSDHQASLESTFGTNVTTRDENGEFIAIIKEKDLFTELHWFKSGENAGILKSFWLQSNVTLNDVNDTSVGITIGFTFSSRNFSDLPDVTTIALRLINPTLEHKESGNFTDYGTTLTLVRAYLVGWKDKDVLKYVIESKDGIFYETAVYTPADVNKPSEGLVVMQNLIYDGFNGFPYDHDASKNLYRPSRAGGIELVPGVIMTFPSPIITPDWKVHDGRVVLARSVFHSLGELLMTPSGVKDITGLSGVDFRDYNATASVMEDEDGSINLITLINMTFSVNGAKYYPSVSNDTVIGQGTLDVSLYLMTEKTFTSDGVLIGMTFNFSLKVLASSFGFYNQTNAARSIINGKLDASGAITLQNPSDFVITSSKGESNLSTKESGFKISGFDLVFFLLPATSLAIILVVRRRRNDGKI